MNEHVQHMMNDPSTTMHFDVERVSIQPGRSFSEEAMNGLRDQMMLWVMTRCARRWNITEEPPTALHVELTVHVS